MNYKTQNWETFFVDRDIMCIFAELKDAERALNTALNHAGKVIHPGAFIVFCGILKNIINETDWFQEMCEKADLECFYPDHKEPEKEEVKP